MAMHTFMKDVQQKTNSQQAANPVQFRLSLDEADTGRDSAAPYSRLPDPRHDYRLRHILEEKLGVLFEASADALILVDASGHIHLSNKEAEYLFRYPAGNLIGQHFNKLIPERFREKHGDYLLEMRSRPQKRKIAQGRPIYCLTRTGYEMPVEISLSPLREQSQTLFLVQFRNVQRELKEKERLRRARKQADQANRTKSRFLAAASHDLRQPLQAISMYLGLLAGTLDDDTRTGTIEKTRMSLTAIQKLLDSLLEISKLESGKVALELSKFPISQVLESVYNTGKPLAERKEQRFGLVPCSASVYTDARLLEQLISNLVANAIRYTPDGGHVVLGCRRRGAELEIQVRDNGIGIPREELENIFDEYVQLDNKGRRSDTGLGLGLAIVKLITEQLNIPLDIQSEPGRGSTFSLRLPLLAQPQREVPAAKLPALTERFQATILLIEDDAAVQDSTRLFLESTGLRVLTAGCSKEALLMLDDPAMHPDLIISDYNLHVGENGIRAIDAIRRKLARELPALLITGDVSDRRMEQAQEGRCDLIRKPVESDKLLQSIATLLPPWMRSASF